MEKYSRYYGLMIFVVAVFILVYGSYSLIKPKIDELAETKNALAQRETKLSTKQQQLAIVQKKIKTIKDSIIGSQKKIYSPIESDLGNDSLFFTLYNDIIEMVHSNSVKIKSINYTYNPQEDEFVKFGRDVYFVCDIDLSLVSNYVNLGKLVQDLYQYPYYIKINEVNVEPYKKDKKILLTKMSLRLYAHTEPEKDAPIENTTLPKI